MASLLRPLCRSRPGLIRLGLTASLLALPWALGSCGSRGTVPAAGRSGPPAARQGRAPPRQPTAIEDVVKEAGGSSAGEAAPAATPPSAQAVARRVLVLRAVAAAQFFPRAGESASRAELRRSEAERNRILEWLRRHEAWEAASAREREMLLTPVGSVEGDKVHPISARGEALLMMLWALGEVRSIPPFDRRAPPTEMETRLPGVDEPAEEFIAEARLRPRAQIEEARQAAQVWYYRALAHQIMKESLYPRGQELDLQVRELQENARAEGFELGPIRNGRSYFEELIRFVAHHAHRRGLIGEPIEEDFPARQKSYASISDREFMVLREVASQRHHALEWLSGFLVDWDGAAGEE